MWNLVRLSTHFVGSTGRKISSITASRSALVEISGLCWVDSTTASSPTGLSSS